MRTLYERLSELLAQGFFPDNLLAAALLAEESSWQTDNPLGLYVLSRILKTLAEDWPRQGLPSLLADEMAAGMNQPVMAYIWAAARGLSADEEAQHLNEIIRAFLKWRSHHD
jgi:hypothetical protein